MFTIDIYFDATLDKFVDDNYFYQDENLATEIVFHIPDALLDCDTYKLNIRLNSGIMATVSLTPTNGLLTYIVPSTYTGAIGYVFMQVEFGKSDGFKGKSKVYHFEIKPSVK